MSSNLRNKEYFFENRSYSKEEYRKKLKEIKLSSYGTQEKLRSQFTDLTRRALHKHANIVKSLDAMGDNITGSKNVTRSFDIRDCENVHYGVRVLGSKDGWDINNAGPGCELFYEGIDVGLNDSNYKFSVDSWEGCFDLEYADLCMNSQHILGCVGLRNKEYHILNKAYSRDEYSKLVEKIKEHMTKMPYIDKAGRCYTYGEFLPIEFSPFAYNTTLAQENFPLTKEVAVKEGYAWRKADERSYKITLESKNLPDDINDVSETLLDEVIGCVHAANCNEECTKAFKLTKDEFDLYKKLNIPLPRLCPNCRHYQRLKQRNPLKLWHRQCMCAGQKSENGVYQNTTKHFHGSGHCPNEFETSYTPDRKEIVYCEQCYQSEVV